jgi:hypothetical protein
MHFSATYCQVNFIQGFYSRKDFCYVFHLKQIVISHCCTPMFYLSPGMHRISWHTGEYSLLIKCEHYLQRVGLLMDCCVHRLVKI